MTTPDVAAIARGLTKAQRATLLALSEHPCQLGCSEPYAKRLAKANTRRPALVDMEYLGTIPWPYFRLNDAGLAVRAHLASEGE
jgi:hypothetical protein